RIVRMCGQFAAQNTLGPSQIAALNRHRRRLRRRPLRPRARDRQEHKQAELPNHSTHGADILNYRSLAHATISPMLLRSLCAIAVLPFAAFTQSGTTPLILEENVPMIDIEFARADGSTVTGRFLIDSGGGAFIISEKLADRIGLKASGPRRKS